MIDTDYSKSHAADSEDVLEIKAYIRCLECETSHLREEMSRRNQKHESMSTFDGDLFDLIERNRIKVQDKVVELILVQAAEIFSNYLQQNPEEKANLDKAFRRFYLQPGYYILDRSGKRICTGDRKFMHIGPGYHQDRYVLIADWIIRRSGLINHVFGDELSNITLAVDFYFRFRIWIEGRLALEKVKNELRAQEKALENFDTAAEAHHEQLYHLDMRATSVEESAWIAREYENMASRRTQIYAKTQEIEKEQKIIIDKVRDIFRPSFQTTDKRR